MNLCVRPLEFLQRTFAQQHVNLNSEGCCPVSYSQLCIYKSWDGEDKKEGRRKENRETERVDWRDRRDKDGENAHAGRECLIIPAESAVYFGRM